MAISIVNPYSVAPSGPFNELEFLDHAYDASSAVSGGDGTDLTGWDDLIGSLDMTVFSSWPVYRAATTSMNNEPAVEFTDSDSMTTATTAAWTFPYTKVLVFELQTVQSGRYIIGAESGRADMRQDTSYYRAYGGAFLNSGTAPAAGQKILVWIVYDSSGAIRVNGTTVSGSTGTTASYGLAIGKPSRSAQKTVFHGIADGVDLLTDNAAWVAEFETWADNKWDLGGWS